MSAAGHNANYTAQQDDDDDFKQEIFDLFFGTTPESTTTSGDNAATTVPVGSLTPQFTSHKKHKASQQPEAPANKRFTVMDVLAAQNLTSPYRGVAKISNRAWSATFKYQEFRYEIGKFHREADAAQAYDFFIQSIFLLLHREGYLDAAEYIKRNYKHNFYTLVAPIAPLESAPNQNVDHDIRTVLHRITQTQQLKPVLTL